MKISPQKVSPWGLRRNSTRKKKVPFQKTFMFKAIIVVSFLALWHMGLFQRSYDDQYKTALRGKKEHGVDMHTETVAANPVTDTGAEFLMNLNLGSETDDYPGDGMELFGSQAEEQAKEFVMEGAEEGVDGQAEENTKEAVDEEPQKEVSSGIFDETSVETTDGTTDETSDIDQGSIASGEGDDTVANGEQIPAASPADAPGGDDNPTFEPTWNPTEEEDEEESKNTDKEANGHAIDETSDGDQGSTASEEGDDTTANEEEIPAASPADAPGDDENPTFEPTWNPTEEEDKDDEESKNTDKEANEMEESEVENTEDVADEEEADGESVNEAEADGEADDTAEDAVNNVANEGVEEEGNEEAGDAAEDSTEEENPQEETEAGADTDGAETNDVESVEDATEAINALDPVAPALNSAEVDEALDTAETNAAERDVARAPEIISTVLFICSDSCDSIADIVERQFGDNVQVKVSGGSACLMGCSIDKPNEDPRDFTQTIINIVSTKTRAEVQAITKNALDAKDIDNSVSLSPGGLGAEASPDAPETNATEPDAPAPDATEVETAPDADLAVVEVAKVTPDTSEANGTDPAAESTEATAADASEAEAALDTPETAEDPAATAVDATEAEAALDTPETEEDPAPDATEAAASDATEAEAALDTSETEEAPASDTAEAKATEPAQETEPAASSATKVALTEEEIDALKEKQMALWKVTSESFDGSSWKDPSTFTTVNEDAYRKVIEEAQKSAKSVVDDVYTECELYILPGTKKGREWRDGKPEIQFKCLGGGNSNAAFQNDLCHTANVCKVVLDEKAWSTPTDSTKTTEPKATSALLMVVDRLEDLIETNHFKAMMNKASYAYQSNRPFYVWIGDIDKTELNKREIETIEPAFGTKCATQEYDNSIDYYKPIALLALFKILDSSPEDIDTVLYLDADAYFHSWAFDHISDTNNDSSEALPLGPESYLGLSPQASMIGTTTKKLMSSGVMILRTTTWSKEFMALWWFVRCGYNDHLGLWLSMYVTFSVWTANAGDGSESGEEAPTQFAYPPQIFFDYSTVGKKLFMHFRRYAGNLQRAWEASIQKSDEPNGYKYPVPTNTKLYHGGDLSKPKLSAPIELPNVLILSPDGNFSYNKTIDAGTTIVNLPKLKTENDKDTAALVTQSENGSYCTNGRCLPYTQA